MGPSCLFWLLQLLNCIHVGWYLYPVSTRYLGAQKVFWYLLNSHQIWILNLEKITFNICWHEHLTHRLTTCNWAIDKLLSSEYHSVIMWKTLHKHTYVNANIKHNNKNGSQCTLMFRHEEKKSSYQHQLNKINQHSSFLIANSQRSMPQGIYESN